MIAVDLQSLFDIRDRANKFSSVREELEAVANGRKAMSVFLFPDSLIGTDYFYTELLELASELHIPTSLRRKEALGPDLPVQMSYLFIFRHNEEWRIPAYLTLKKICEHYGWSDAAEHLEGSLLGYTDQEIACWLREHWSVRAGWTGKTLIFLVPSTVANGVRKLGKRSIGADDVGEPLLVFFNRRRNPLRSEAYDRIPKECELMRVSVKECFFRKLFGSPTQTASGDIVALRVGKEAVPALNSAAESNFQFFGPHGWQ